MGTASLLARPRRTLLFAATVSLCAAASAQTIPTARVSVDSLGIEGSSSSVGSTINYDGRYVVFSSGSPELVPGDTNNKTDIFHHDRLTKITTRVNVSSSGAQAVGGISLYPALSPAGTYVAFTSGASNLVPGDTNGKADVFVRDLVGGVTTRVSKSSTGVQADEGCFQPAISAGGRFVAFQSRAENLVPGDTNGQIDVFVHDSVTGETERVSISFVGQQLAKGGTAPSISWDGRYVAFESTSNDVVFADTNGVSDIFLRDRVLGTTRLVSVNSDGTQMQVTSRYPTITADGRLIAFWNQNWVGVHVHDKATGITTFEANGFIPTISTNGLFVAYHQPSGVYVRNREQGTTLYVSEPAPGGSPGGNNSHRIATLSGDGSIVSFESDAALVPGDTNGQVDIFVHGASNCAPYDVYCTPSTSSILGCTPLVSASGTPTMSNPGGFSVSCSSVPGGNNVGMFFFGDNGPANFNVGSLGGKMCVLPPFDRSAPKANGGLPGVCNGYLEFDLAELEASSPLITAGKVIHGEFWVRDVANDDGFVFSNGVTFTLCP